MKIFSMIIGFVMILSLEDKDIKAGKIPFITIWVICATILIIIPVLIQYGILS